LTDEELSARADKLPLARVFDASELETIAGGRATLAIRVLAAWAGESCTITVPRTLRCAPCDGGGCDGCGRSGAFRLETTRELVVHLPEPLPANVRLRLPEPFGANSGIALLLLDVETAEDPTPTCRIAPKSAPAPVTRSPWPLVALAVAALLALGFLVRAWG
jgi:hypothetical protein